MTDDSTQLLSGLYAAYDELNKVKAQSDDEMVALAILKAMFEINCAHFYLSGEMIE